MDDRIEQDGQVSLNENQYLTFSLGKETYGLPISSVREVIGYSRISRIPLSFNTVKGVMNLRGNVITVVDLSARLYGHSNSSSKKGVVVIAECEDDGQSQQIGMLIDGVNAVIDLPEELTEEEPSFGAKIRSDFISRIGKSDGEFIIILNASKVLDLSELSDLNAKSLKHQTAETVRA